MDRSRIDSPNNAVDLAKLVAVASRFFNVLADWSIFNDREFDLPQWVLLVELSLKDGATIAGLAKSLGISKSHAQAIATSLENLGFVTSSEDAVTGVKRLSITNDGADRLTAVNADIAPILEEILGDKIHLIRAVAGFFSLILKISHDKK